MTEKKKNVIACLLIVLCLVAFGGFLSQQYTGTLSGQETCRIADTKTSMSPTGKLDAVVEFLDCGEAGGETIVLLYQRSSTDRAGVLIRIKQRSILGKTKPIHVETNWVAATELEIHVPQEYMPNRNRDDWYGASINFVAMEH